MEYTLFSLTAGLASTDSGSDPAAISEYDVSGVVTPRGIAMLMTSKTAEGRNHGVQLMETDHSKSGGELQSLSQHVTDMRNP